MQRKKKAASSIRRRRRSHDDLIRAHHRNPGSYSATAAGYRTTRGEHLDLIELRCTEDGYRSPHRGAESQAAAVATAVPSAYPKDEASCRISSATPTSTRSETFTHEERRIHPGDDAAAHTGAARL